MLRQLVALRVPGSEYADPFMPSSRTTVRVLAALTAVAFNFQQREVSPSRPSMRRLLTAHNRNRDRNYRVSHLQ